MKSLAATPLLALLFTGCASSTLRQPLPHVAPAKSPEFRQTMGR